VESGALTAVVSAEVERLRAQHADAVREKSAADSKCRKLAEKVAALEGERTDLQRQLVEESREPNQALAKAQSAQAEANLAWVEGSLASQRAEEWETRFNTLQARMERAEASTRSEVERTRKQLMDSYRELGARTADFEVPTESQAFAASSGCKRNCWGSRPLWRDLCLLPPWSPTKGR
jgi:chromosome segregation ATPase